MYLEATPALHAKIISLLADEPDGMEVEKFFMSFEGRIPIRWADEFYEAVNAVGELTEGGLLRLKEGQGQADLNW